MDKVLILISFFSLNDAIYLEHQVVTIETGKLSWRMIECDVPHFPHYTSVCINGVLYYKAALHGSSFVDTIMSSFDVRSEKYNFIKRKRNGWFKHVYKLPPIWENVAADNFLRKWTCSNEVVLVKYSLYGPFYVFYYSLETETSRIVEIQGLGSFGGFRIYTFVDHIFKSFHANFT
ncbi:hypothetical protein HID58_089764 [Brassica napus]|uniref:F-box associated beta-propeller type 3 domain-containing protein n=1 Tax=Brassica napus TaxID=3708 RepID=A0ABQ7Y005_BRANA|nr:hypothetical protein HID58_089764 [Brassica napus]